MEKKIDLNSIVSIQRWDALPPELFERAKAMLPTINEHLLMGKPQTLKEWTSGFLCDLHPEREIEVWERMIKRYLKSIKNISDLKERRTIWFEILSSPGVIIIDDKSKN